MERLFFNMVLYKDDLFKEFEPEIPADYGYFFPLAYRSREMVWSEGQVEDTFGSLIRLQKCKWIFLSILIFLGIVALILSLLCCRRYRRIRSELPPSVIDERPVSAFSTEPAARWSIND